MGPGEGSALFPEVMGPSKALVLFGTCRKEERLLQPPFLSQLLSQLPQELLPSPGP